MLKKLLVTTLCSVTAVSMSPALAQSSIWYRFADPKFMIYVNSSSVTGKGTKVKAKVFMRLRLARADRLSYQIQWREYDCIAKGYYLLEYSSFDVRGRLLPALREEADKGFIKADVSDMGAEVLNFICNGAKSTAVTVADPFKD